MADLSTLARPYAKAAFDFAQESNAIREWDKFLVLASNITQDQDFLQMLNNPTITAKQKAEVLLNVYNSSQIDETEESSETIIGTIITAGQKLFGKPTDLSPQETKVKINNFVAQLADNHRLALIPEIYTHFHKYKTEASNQVDAYVTSAYPLTDTQRELIQSRLAVSMNATVILHEAIDKSLLAGATIKVGDKIVDDTVRGKLKQLRTQLTT